MSNIPRIVLTGGPGGGKSTTLAHIEKAIPSVYIEPEAATMILQAGYPMPGPGRPWTQAWQECFQTAVKGMQDGLDQLANYEAAEQGMQAIVQDRSHVDAAGYYPSTAAFEQKSGTTLGKELGRASMAFFLPTFAGTAHYDPSTNLHRFEAQEEMIQLNDRLLELWRPHPALCIIDDPKLENRTKIVAELIQEAL